MEHLPNSFQQTQAQKALIDRGYQRLHFLESKTIGPCLEIPDVVMPVIPNTVYHFKSVSRVDSLVVTSPQLMSLKLHSDAFFVPLNMFLPELNYSLEQLNPVATEIPQTPGPMASTKNLTSQLYFQGAGHALSVRKSASSLEADRSAFALPLNVVEPGSFFNYIGFPVDFWQPYPGTVNTQTGSAEFNPAIPGIPAYYILGYCAIYYHYYANLQTNSIYALSRQADIGIPEKRVGVGSVSLSGFRSALRSALVNGVSVPTVADNVYKAFFPHGDLYGRSCGLYLAPLHPDRANSFTSVTNFTQLTNAGHVPVYGTSGSSQFIEINDIIAKMAAQQLIGTSYYSASTFHDWMINEYGITPPASMMYPTLISHSESNVTFSSIVDQSSENLGDLAARAMSEDSSFAFKFQPATYGAIFIMKSIVPEVSYRQNISEDFFLKKLSDIPAPDTALLPYSTLPQYVQGIHIKETHGGTGGDEEFDVYSGAHAGIGSYPVNIINTSAVGIQDAWAAWRNRLSRVSGDLADSLSTWVYLNDKYNPRSSALTVNPYLSIDRDLSYAYPQIVLNNFEYNSTGVQPFLLRTVYDIDMSLPFRFPTRAPYLNVKG